MSRSHPRSPAQRLVVSASLLLVASGLVMLATVAWQLWGTGIATARAQHRLGQQFSAALQTPPTLQTTPTPSVARSSTAAADVVPPPVATQPAATQPSPPIGTAIAHLVIPKIGVDDYVVEGTGSAQLAEGPGHYSGTAAHRGQRERRHRRPPDHSRRPLLQPQ